MSTITVNRFLDAVGNYLRCNLNVDSTFDESINVLSKKYTNKKAPTITVGESLEPSQAGVFKFVRNELGRPEIHIGFNGAAPTIIINEDRCTINGEEPNGCECVPPDPTYLAVTGYKADGTGPMADIGRFRISNAKSGGDGSVGFHYTENNGYVDQFATLDNEQIQINKHIVLTEGLAIYRGGFRFWSPAEDATATIQQSLEYIKLSNMKTNIARIQSLRLIDPDNEYGDSALIYRKSTGEVMITGTDGNEFVLNQKPLVNDSNYAKLDQFATLVAADATVQTLTTGLANVNTQISTMDNKITVANTNNTSLWSGLEKTDGNVTKLNAELTAAKAEITKLTSDLKTANDNNTTLTNSLTAANTNITTLSTNLTALTSRVAALEEVLANYRTVLEQLLDDHNLEDTDTSDSLKFSIGVKQVTE